MPNSTRGDVAASFVMRGPRAAVRLHEQVASSPPSVLVVKDSVLEDLAPLLRSGGFAAFEASATSIGPKGSLQVPDCMIVGHRPPEFDALDFIDRLRTPHGQLPCALIVLGDGSNAALASAAMKAGALDFLAVGDCNEHGLGEAVRAAVQKYRKEEEHRLRAREDAHLAALVRASADAILGIGADGKLIRSWSPAATRLFGFEEREAVGRTLDELLIPESKREEREELLATARSRREAFVVETERLHKSGALIPVEINVSPVSWGPDDTGFSVIFRDISERRRTQNAIRESQHKLARREAELSRAQRIARIGSYEVECRDGKFLNRLSPECLAIHGLPPEAWNEQHEAWVQRIHPDDRGWSEKALKRAIAEGATEYEAEYRIIRPSDGETRWIKVLAEIDRDPSGSPIRLFGTHIDITERKRAEEELRESEERLRLTIEAAGIGTFSIDVADGVARYSPELASMLGFPGVSQARIEQAFARVHREDVARVHAQYERAHDPSTGGRLCMEFRFVRPGGQVRWMTWNGKVEFQSTEAGGRVPVRVLGACADITERKQSEERLRLLMREVNHRSKNMLTVVQAIARQTAAKGDDFVKRFEERVRALAANQDLLVRSAWKGVDLNELVRSQLAHFADLIDSRISMAGPPLIVSARASETLGMALHELATNAGKYGALSNAVGEVSIRWEVRADPGADPRFSIVWREKGGPPVTLPQRNGFGSMVIDTMARMSLDGSVFLDHAKTGLEWRLECSLKKMIDESSNSEGPIGQSSISVTRGDHARILVVEDEALVALEIAGALTAAGFEVMGPAGSVARALQLLKGCKCDAAVLDVNLGAETAEAVAVELARSGTPFVTVSGYTRDQQPAVFRSSCCVSKPLQPEAIIAAVQMCVRKATTA